MGSVPVLTWITKLFSSLLSLMSSRDARRCRRLSSLFRNTSPHKTHDAGLDLWSLSHSLFHTIFHTRATCSIYKDTILLKIYLVLVHITFRQVSQQLLLLLATSANRRPSPSTQYRKTRLQEEDVHLFCAGSSRRARQICTRAGP